MLKTYFNILLILACAWVASAAQANDVPGSFGVTHGIMIYADDLGEEQIWYGGGITDPSVLPGIDAPLGSSYRRTNGEVYAKTGIGLTDWSLDGLGSSVVTQTADFGKSGNASANSYLNRAGNVSSNVSGIPILVSDGKIQAVVCGTETIDTYDVEFYEHDGDFINPTLLYTLSVVASRTGSQHNLNISVTQDKQLAAKTLDGVKNIGCTLGIKGLSL